MTSIVALKYRGGSVLASDTRVMIGDDIKRDRARKLQLVGGYVGIAAAGLTGACDDIIMKVKELCKSSSSLPFESVANCLSDATLEWYKRNHEKIGEHEEEEAYSFILASPERIRRVDDRGYSEEVADYDCDGTGKKYAEYILGNSYRDDLKEEEAKELAVYTILETSKVDPNVGEDIDLVVFPIMGEAKHISIEEIQDTKHRVAPLSRSFVEEQIRRVEKVVEQRATINELFVSRFKFKLFYPDERAIFQTMKPCRSEGEFTNNVAALALLVEQLNVAEMKKVVSSKEGSINILEEFLRQSIGDYPPEIVTTFRDVMTMRSKKFPIHNTDSKFVEVVIKITGVYPPVWSKLYLRTLSFYNESLTKLLDCLRKPEQFSN